jgi:predicted translin family RNA/ssDNA-binding protein
METTKTGQDIFDYKKELEDDYLTDNQRNALFNQMMRYQDTHDSLVQEYNEIARRAQRSVESLGRGNSVSTLDLVNSHAERIAELVYKLKAQADALTTMHYVLEVKIDWTEYIKK